MNAITCAAEVLPSKRVTAPIRNISMARWKCLRTILVNGHSARLPAGGRPQHDWAQREGLVEWKDVNLGGGMIGGKYVLTARGADTLRANS